METFFDDNQIRYRLASTQSGDGDWLFLPGGPGGDSSYFLSLLPHLDLPGRAWLIDLPGNGDNAVADDYDYDRWLDLFPTIVDRFEKPILVAHSASAHFALLSPELEEKLSALLLLNTTPSLWLEEAVRYKEPFNLPDLTEEMTAFTINPNQQTFDVALNACIPYYFSPSHIEAGRKMLLPIPFPWRPAVWWQRKATETNFNATWIPQKVLTTIVGGHFDCMTPFTLFEKDQRFRRQNIELVNIHDAGHLPWVENPAVVRRVFDDLIIKRR